MNYGDPKTANAQALREAAQRAADEIVLRQMDRRIFHTAAVPHGDARGNICALVSAKLSENHQQLEGIHGLSFRAGAGKDSQRQHNDRPDDDEPDRA
jgi:hypothetical protein